MTSPSTISGGYFSTSLFSAVLLQSTNSEIPPPPPFLLFNPNFVGVRIRGGEASKVHPLLLRREKEKKRRSLPLLSPLLKRFSLFLKGSKGAGRGLGGYRTNCRSVPSPLLTSHSNNSFHLIMDSSISVLSAGLYSLSPSKPDLPPPLSPPLIFS